MNKYYKTNNFHFAVYLIASKKAEFININFITPKKAEFIFTNSPIIGGLIDEFHSRKTIINLWNFIEAQKFLKSAIYDR